MPSKTYSILAAGRPALAAIDPGTEVPRILEASGAGTCVPPDDVQAFREALQQMAGDEQGHRHHHRVRQPGLGLVAVAVYGRFKMRS